MLVSCIFQDAAPDSERVKHLKKGMRLEALDRKNPGLICVATIGRLFPLNYVWSDKLFEHQVGCQYFQVYNVNLIGQP